MSKTINELQLMMIEQLKRRGYYPKDEKEVLLRLGEELGELFEAVREKQNQEDSSLEVADILWNLMRFCELQNIDLEKAFIDKYKKNEKRPLDGPVKDISQNA